MTKHQPTTMTLLLVLLMCISGIYFYQGLQIHGAMTTELQALEGLGKMITGVGVLLFGILVGIVALNRRTKK